MQISAKAYFSPFLSVGHCLNYLDAPLSSSLLSKTPDSPLEFRFYLSKFQRYKYFRFWKPHCHFRLSVVTQSPALTFFELAVIECFKFAVGISILTVVARGHKTISGFGCHITISGMYQSPTNSLSSVAVVENPSSKVRISMLSLSAIFPDKHVLPRFWRSLSFRLTVVVSRV